MSAAFDRWLSSNAPSTHDDGDEARHLWARIEDRIHERRQRRITRGSGLAAAAVLVLVLGIVDVTPLGGNNWNLIDSSRREGVVEDPLTGHLYTTVIGFEDGKDGDIPAQVFWETVREQQASGNYTLEAIEFYQVGDDIEWTLFNRHQIGSYSRTATQQVPGTSNLSKETWDWLTPHAMALANGNQDGRWRETAARRYAFNGETYWFRIWTTDTEHGPVYFGEAVIPGKSQ